MKSYQELLDIGREIATLDGISQLLDWDQETYMPPSAAAARSSQLELIAKLIHEKRTGKPFRTKLAGLIDLDTGKVKVKGLSLPQKAALREWRRDLVDASKLPTQFIQKEAKLASQATLAWRAAKEASSFGRFAPYLEKLVHLARDKAEKLGYSQHPYDALVNQHEPGMTYRKVKTLFNALKKELIPLRKSLKRHPKRDFLHKRYSEKRQMEFAEELLHACGWSRERGTLDLTTHPFCVATHPTDARVTTKVVVDDPMVNFLACLHEGGHYLYDIGLPAEQFGSPLGEALSTALHESQSRWWECLIGQSLPFWTYYFPKLKAAFPTQLKGVTLNRFYKGLNALLPTPIRIYADEVSYPLHVILRFEIESALIDGSLAIRDLPHMWNAKVEEYLGMTPRTHAEGCLQDIHWAFGGFGYFPTYLLGNIYSAQFFETFSKEYPNWASRVAKGEFGFIHEWLRENIHQHGRTYTPEQLVKRVTGSALTSGPYITYLTQKYQEIYKSR